MRLGIMLSVAISLLSLAAAQSLRLEKYRGRPQSVTHLRVASVAVLPEKWEKEKNWRRIENKVREAAANGAHLVVTPEGALEGYVINEVNAVADASSRKTELLRTFFELGEPLDGGYLRRACSLANELDIYFTLGFLERAQEALYNSVVLIDPDGDIIGKYSKTHFAQGYEINPEFYRPGDEYPVFSTPFGLVGMLICYDRQLPEPARILALKGAQILLVPAYGSYTDENGWNTVVMRTRAYENGFPVVFSHPFQSLLISRDGVLRAIGGADQIAYFEVNTDPARYEGRFRNRRSNTYGRLILDQ